MAEWTEAKEIVCRIQEKHISESGKVLQKLLALTLQRLGFDFCEERSIQGVDIDVANRETGERHSFEVKTSKSSSISIAAKDIEGLEMRKEDGYDTYFAVLCQPLCFSAGWIIFPSDKVKVGQYNASRLLRSRDEGLSERINEVFPDVACEIGPGIIACRPGTAMLYMKKEHGI
jgi:hypothetical protein